MNEMKHNCTGMESKLADLLLDPESVSAKVYAHVAECDGCRGELEELKATMGLLDVWQVPEPSPYFMTRMQARMREERESAPAGLLAAWFARLRADFAYGPGLHARPLVATALTVMLLIGGGTYLDLTVNDWNKTPQPNSQAAVVHDLQTLDSNAQLLDQMESLSTASNDDGD